MSDMVISSEEFPKAFEHALNSGELERISALYDEAAVIRGGSGENAGTHTERPDHKEPSTCG